MSTNRETIRLLCKSIINRLENRKAITFPARLRAIVQDELFDLVGPYIVSEQDVRERALAKMGAKAEQLQETSFTESDQFKAAKALVKASLGDDVLNGFYFQKPLKTIAQSVVAYLMRSSHIDDVFETDEELERQLVEIVQKFDPKELH
ncbi:DUF507 family protein [bacterium]|jgi:hypothetical protein|nr:DUF507 family protein [bacterium]